MDVMGNGRGQGNEGILAKRIRCFITSQQSEEINELQIVFVLSMASV